MRILLAALVMLSGAESRQESLVKKVVPDAERIKKVSGRIGADAQKRIEGLLGSKLDRGDLSPVVYQCWGTVPAVSSSDKTRIRVVFTSVKGPKGMIKLAVAVAVDDDLVRSVSVIDNKDDKAVALREFLAQFDGFEYVASIENEAAMLETALKEAQGDKELTAALKTNETMREMGPAWERMSQKIGKKDKSAVSDIDAMIKGLKEGMKYAPDLGFLSGSSLDRYKDYSHKSEEGFEKMKKMIASGDFDGAYKESGEIDSHGCASCHGSYRRRFFFLREGADLGNGYFSTKLDVQMPVKSLKAAYQAVATGVRKAILIAGEL